MVTYKKIKLMFNQTVEDSVIKIDGSEYSTIPFDSNNTDYQEYLYWLSLGNIPEPAE